jgi:antitoxin component YwqK of YwqJK toxin-antitoxin module
MYPDSGTTFKKFVVCNKVYNLWDAKPDVRDYKLTHLVYNIRHSNGNYHAVTAFVCNGKRFIYDSNRSKVLKVDWTDSKNKSTIIKYSPSGQTLWGVNYALYVRDS